MDYRRGNARFPGYEMTYPYSPQPPPQGFPMIPFNPPVMPGFLYQQQQNQYSGPESPNPPQMLPPDARFGNPHFYPMQSLSPALIDPTRRARFAHTPLPAPIPQFTAHFKQPEILSPLTRGAADSQFDQLLKIESQNQLDGPRAPGVTKSIDKVALPSEMPIGSLVHLQCPPKWGVIKIANIPYSITKQEIVQFLGRQARLITPDKGCPVHIIMERSTAKTMDCYVEMETPANAKETVDSINRIYETGRAPRLGNRHVDVEVSNQDALLKDLFPRAKCVSWQDGVPIVFPNIDPYSTGYAGLFTSEEIVGAIRHAEIPHRSPFCAKCPQRTYESTVSTMYKFPWFATKIYTVHDRNLLFELVNRHIQSLVSRVRRSNTVGLDQRLLRDLLYAGLNCPAFNERQKYTLCINSDELSEIVKFPDMGKWFPFDTLVKMPKLDEKTVLYYANLISNGTVRHHATTELPNTFPAENFELHSPYGRIWFEWPLDVAKLMTWEDAVQHEMVNLCNLVLSGWISNDKMTMLNTGTVSGESSSSSSRVSRRRNLTISPSGTDKSQISEDTSSNAGVFGTHSRRASDLHSYQSAYTSNSDASWSQKFIRPTTRARAGFLGHRNTLSSPTCFP
ncbi:hypothetical protein MW887_004912 [Aspergillus wentii]|nr:hypothetical protein MW887_004912 [Aspergillus wentii]